MTAEQIARLGKTTPVTPARFRRLMDERARLLEALRRCGEMIYDSAVSPAEEAHFIAAAIAFAEEPSP